jgi:hypothetical protein
MAGSPNPRPSRTETSSHFAEAQIHARLTNPAKQNIITSIRGSKRQMADIKSEPRPASNRNRWPASYWNAWPGSSESAARVIVTDRQDHDFIRGQRAADRRVDPGEGKLLRRVGSLAQGDVERETAAVFFQPGQKGALDFATRQGNTEGKESSRRPERRRARQRFTSPDSAVRQNWTSVRLPCDLGDYP